VALDELIDPSLREETDRLCFGLDSGLGRAIDQVRETDVVS
jgi:hypothetical protein